MEKNIRIPEEIIANKIYHIRGQKVMLDRDLAAMYGVETKRLKEQVKRNKERFPLHFMFELTHKENDVLRSQNATLKRGEHSKYLPFVFTEYGILMLSNVIKTSKAVSISIEIIDVFIKLRAVILNHKDVLLKLEKLDNKLINVGLEIQNHDDEIETLFELIDEIRKESDVSKKVKRNRIGYPLPEIKK